MLRDTYNNLIGMNLFWIHGGKECFVFIHLPPIHTIDYSHVIIEIKFYLKLEHFVVDSRELEKAKKRKNEPCEELRSLVGLNDFLRWIFDVYVLGSTMKHKKSSAQAQKSSSSIFLRSPPSFLPPRSAVCCLHTHLGWGAMLLCVY